MMTTQNITQIFEPGGFDFNEFALLFFRHQSQHLPVYREFLRLLHCEPSMVRHYSEIPFLPISFFKQHELICNKVELSSEQSTPVLFESSGTGGHEVSRHFVKDPHLYERSFLQGFQRVYGDPSSFIILALLPSYLERQHSSLVYMVDALIRKSGSPFNGTFLYDHETLAASLQDAENAAMPCMLIGVTYALLDFAQAFPMKLKHTMVMETGGMKGRREELLRDEVHAIIKKQFSLTTVHSEYGMTELLSQAYSVSEGIFYCPPWMRVLVRDMNDPLEIKVSGKGVLCMIDLANIHSCCFIATQDLGEVFPDGSFTVLGRLDGSDLRGCSLMYI